MMKTKRENSSAGVLIICGPTAVGKSKFAFSLALKVRGEIISADAFQLYRGLDIGTDKPSFRERQLVPHHLIDTLSPEEKADAYHYAQQVRKLISEILAQGRLPIIVGGSGLYLRAVTDGFFEVPETAGQDEVRRRLSLLPPLDLYQRLIQIDPKSASRIHPKDTYRLRRALEVYYLTGKPLSAWQRQSQPLRVPFYLVGLWRPRSELYRRIEERVERIFLSGFLDEVASLQKRYDFSRPAFNAIGYREAADYLAGRSSLEETKEKIKRRTRNYAKRQLTWFRKDRRVLWLNITGDVIQPQSCKDGRPVLPFR